MNEIVRQRIKFLIEHGELNPEKPLGRSLAVKLLGVVILLQLLDIALRAAGWR
jgi:hypothetical protein